MSAIRISGARADQYRDYRDICEAFDPALLSSYRTALVENPKKFDAVTIALVLHDGRIADPTEPAAWANVQAVRFLQSASGAFVRALDVGKTVRYGELRSGLEVRPSAEEVVIACERAGAQQLLADAFTLLFVEAHPKLVEVVAHEAIADDDAGDDAADSDEPPPGYPGGEDDDTSPPNAEE